MVSMLVYVDACVCVYALRIVSTDTILSFINTLIIIRAARKSRILAETLSFAAVFVPSLHMTPQVCSSERFP